MENLDICDQCPILQLLDTITFRFEDRFYDKYVKIITDVDEARRRTSHFWSLLDAAFGVEEKAPHSADTGDGFKQKNYHNVSDFLILAWGDESLQTDTATWCYSHSEDRDSCRIGKAREPLTLVNAWCGSDASESNLPWNPETHLHGIMACYFAYSGRQNRTSIHDILERPVFKLSQSSPRFEVFDNGAWFPQSSITMSQRLTQPVPHGQEELRYYQRLAVIFACDGTASLQALARAAPYVLAAEILDWSSKLETSAQKETAEQTFAHSIQGHIFPIQNVLSTLDETQDDVADARAAARKIQFAVNAFDEQRQFRKTLERSRQLRWDECVGDALRLALDRLRNRYARHDKLANHTLKPEEDSRVKSVIKKSIRSRWADQSSELLREICSDAIDGPHDWVVVWADRVEEGLYIHILAQAIFHAAVFACVGRAKLPNRSQESFGLPFLKVSNDDGAGRILIQNRSLAPVERAVYEGSQDGKLIDGMIKKFNAVPFFPRVLR